MNEIDQYFKDKLNKLPFEDYEERVWQALNPRIDEVFPQKRRWWQRKIFVFSSIAGFSFLLGFLFANVAIQTRNADYLQLKSISESTEKFSPEKTLEKKEEFLTTSITKASSEEIQFDYARTSKKFQESSLFKEATLERNKSLEIQTLKNWGFYLDETLKHQVPNQLVSSLDQESQPNLVSTQYTLSFGPGWLKAKDKNLQANAGYAFGITFEKTISPKFSVWANFQGTRLSYLGLSMDENLGIPELSPPSEKFTFREARIDIPSFYFGLGGRLNLIHWNRWKAYVDVGLGGSYIAEYEIEYEFEHEEEEEFYEELTEIPESFHPLQHFVSQAGLTYQISPLWGINMGAQVRLPFQAGKEGGLPISGLSIQLAYSFFGN